MKKDDMLLGDVVNASRPGIRPSVAGSEFFREYSVKRILISPEHALFDLLHTRGIGPKSQQDVADLVAAQLRWLYPEAWRQARDIVAGRAPAQQGLTVWPVDAVVTFITTWGPRIRDQGEG
jgi:hypothetical protein